MTGILGYILSGMIALHTVVGCCLHHAHRSVGPCCSVDASAQIDCCCDNRQEMADAIVVPSWGATRIASSRGDSSCHEIRCDWGIRGTLTESSAVSDAANGPGVSSSVCRVEPPFIGRRFQPDRQSAAGGLDAWRVRRHAALAVFLI